MVYKYEYRSVDGTLRILLCSFQVRVPVLKRVTQGEYRCVVPQMYVDGTSKSTAVPCPAPTVQKHEQPSFGTSTLTNSTPNKCTVALARFLQRLTGISTVLLTLAYSTIYCHVDSGTQAILGCNTYMCDVYLWHTGTSWIRYW